MSIKHLDTVLLYLYNNRRYQYIDEIHTEISKIIQMPIIDVLVILNKLAKDGYITVETHKSTSENPNSGKIKESYRDSYFISFEGVLFVEKYSHNKPYEGLNNSERQSKIWKMAKIIAITANAIIIILIGVFTVQAQIDANQVNNSPTKPDTIYLKCDSIYSIK